MRFVPIKTPEQQSGLVLHRTRHLLVRQRDGCHQCDSGSAEFGIVAPVGRKGVEELLRVVADGNDKRVPDVVRACLGALGTQLLSLKKQILELDRMSIQAEKLRPDRKAPGSATFATRAVASNGPTPRAWCRNSIRAGARTNYLCRLFVAGALSVIRYAKATAVNIDHGSRHCWCGDQPDCGDRACQ